MRYTLSVQCFAIGVSAPFLEILELGESKWVAFNEGEDTGACNATQIRAAFSHSPPREFRDHPVNPFGLGCAWVRRWKGRRLNHMGGAEGPGYRPEAAICTPQGEQPSEPSVALRETEGGILPADLHSHPCHLPLTMLFALLISCFICNINSAFLIFFLHIIIFCQILK